MSLRRHHRRRPTNRPRRVSPALRVMAAALALALVTAGCGDSEPELTIEERLAKVEGRVLTETEVADKLATAGLLCQLDEPVLDAIWRQLNERELNYQDVVFGHICPERSVFYAGLTGRYVTEEAEESGVVTSTTRTVPTPAVTLAPATTTGPSRGTIGPAPTGTQTSTSTDQPADGDGQSTTSAASATIVPQTTSSTVEGEGG